MATKKLTERVNLIDTFKDFKETKNIDRTTLVSVIEDSFRRLRTVSAVCCKRLTALTRTST